MFTWGRINSLFGHQQGFIRGLHVYMGKDKFIVRSSTRFYKRFTCLHGSEGFINSLFGHQQGFIRGFTCLHGEG